MKTSFRPSSLWFLCAWLIQMPEVGDQAHAAGLAGSSDKPGDIERAALAKVSFMVGEWEGDGWYLTSSGQREKFWLREIYQYRGHKDLLDMEGWFRDILPDGQRSADEDYALGILYYDSTSREYRMWHYRNGRIFTVTMDVDIETKSCQYTVRRDSGEMTRFSLHIGEDKVWVSKRELLRPDNTWMQIMEFRMRRIK